MVGESETIRLRLSSISQNYMYRTVEEKPAIINALSCLPLKSGQETACACRSARLAVASLSRPTSSPPPENSNRCGRPAAPASLDCFSAAGTSSLVPSAAAAAAPVNACPPPAHCVRLPPQSTPSQLTPASCAYWNWHCPPLRSTAGRRAPRAWHADACWPPPPRRCCRAASPTVRAWPHLVRPAPSYRGWHCPRMGAAWRLRWSPSGWCPGGWGWGSAGCGWCRHRRGGGRSGRAPAARSAPRPGGGGGGV
eukprot:SAG22_NODE_2826_length_2175_cov_2.013969_1_plen_252_part_00